MPNIGYILDGYDIFYGNPLTTGTSAAIPDPGFRLQTIFKAVYSGNVTPDQRYVVPDGMEIRSCSGDCRMMFGSSKIAGNGMFCFHCTTVRPHDYVIGQLDNKNIVD